MKLCAAGKGIAAEISHLGLRAVAEGVHPHAVFRHLTPAGLSEWRTS